MATFQSQTGKFLEHCKVDDNKLSQNNIYLTGLFREEGKEEIFLTYNGDIIHVFIPESGNLNFHTALQDIESYFKPESDNHQKLNLKMLVTAFKESYLPGQTEKSFTSLINALSGFKTFLNS